MTYRVMQVNETGETFTATTSFSTLGLAELYIQLNIGNYPTSGFYVECDTQPVQYHETPDFEDIPW